MANATAQASQSQNSGGQAGLLAAGTYLGLAQPSFLQLAATETPIDRFFKAVSDMAPKVAELRAEEEAIREELLEVEFWVSKMRQAELEDDY